MAERKKRRDAEENRKIILQKASELFEEKGIEAVSMHQIALSAGVGQGTLYRRYAHKGELCQDLKNENFNKFFADLDAYLADSQEMPLRTRMTDVLRKSIDFIEEQSAWLEVIQAYGSACDGKRWTMYRSSHYEQLHRILSGLLREIPRRSDGRELNPVITADAVLSSLSPDLYSFMRHDRGLSKQDILEGVTSVYVDGLIP